MSKRRKHPRFGPLLIRADFSLDSEETLHKGYVTNLSGGGAFLATRETVPVGSRVRLILLLPWQLGRLEAEAAAVWQRGGQSSAQGNLSPGVGLQFVTVGDASRQKLNKYLEKFQELVASLPGTPR